MRFEFSIQTGAHYRLAQWAVSILKCSGCFCVVIRAVGTPRLSMIMLVATVVPCPM